MKFLNACALYGHLALRIFGEFLIVWLMQEWQALRIFQQHAEFLGLGFGLVGRLDLRFCFPQTQGLMIEAGD